MQVLLHLVQYKGMYHRIRPLLTDLKIGYNKAFVRQVEFCVKCCAPSRTPPLL